MQEDRGAAAVTDAPRTFRILIAVAGVVVALDQATKELALRTLAPGETVSVIGDVLQWKLERNPGAAFGIFQRFPMVFTVLAFVISIGIIVVGRKPRPLSGAIALGLVLGGAVGNLVDRIFRSPAPFRGHVVDFIDLPRWPTFNIADMAVVAGALLLVILSFREERASS